MNVKVNRILGIFFVIVLVYILGSSLQRGFPQKTGLAPAQMMILNDINRSISALQDQAAKNPSDALKKELGRKYFEYDLALAEFYGVRPGNEPFLLEGNSGIGVVLIHGFSASPYEVRELAEYLNQKGGITVYAPLIIGHGTDYRNFGAYSWEEWRNSIRNAINAVSLMEPEVYAGGVSLGGNLALDIAKERNLAGVFAIGAPVYYKNAFAESSHVLKFFLQSLPNNNLDEIEKQYYYHNRSVSAIAELMSYTEAFKQQLDSIQEPVLLFQSDDDRTIDPKSADFILNNIGSDDKKLKKFPGDSHIIIDQEVKKLVFRDILNFILEHSEPS